MSKDFLSGLADESAGQVVKFIRFFNSKRENLLSAVGAEFEESSELLHDDEYSKSEVQRHILAPLATSTKHLVRDEHTNVVNMVVLLLKQVFESAEAQGCELDLDMSAVEDAALLEEVAQIRVEMRANEAAAAENGEAKQGFDATPAKLSKLKDDHAALVRNSSRLREGAAAHELEARRAQEQLREATAQLSLAQQENARLADEVQKLRSQPQQGRGGGSSARMGTNSHAQSKDDDDDVDEIDRERGENGSSEGRRTEGELLASLAAERLALAEAKGGLDAHAEAHAKSEHEASRLREDLRRAEDEANARLSSSSQVAQLRRLLKQKNDMVASLRHRLNRYEPEDSGPDANDE